MPRNGRGRYGLQLKVKEERGACLSALPASPAAAVAFVAAAALVVAAAAAAACVGVMGYAHL
jgi:hypothetical protein